MDEQIKFLNNFILIEEQLYDVYQKLKEIEIAGNNENIALLKELNDLYEAEKKIINTIPNDLDEVSALQLVLFLTPDKLSYSVLEEKQAYIELRMMSHLEHLAEILEAKEELYDEEDDYDIDRPTLNTTVEQEVSKNFAIEFYKRLQNRIDNASQDKDALINEKYDMLYTLPLLNSEALCTGFTFQDSIIADSAIVASNLGITQTIYEIEYLLYMREMVYDTIEKLAILERAETDLSQKRVDFKIEDLHLEIALSYFGFVNLYNLKEKTLKNLEAKGMKNSATYFIVQTNFDEAIKFACNYPRKLKTKPHIKTIEPGVIRVEAS